VSKGDFGDECGTAGCADLGMGVPLAVPGSGVHRCSTCHDCISALAPDWAPGLTDWDAYEARGSAIGEMRADTLRTEAAPVLARINAARDAYTKLADLIGATAAAELVTAIVNAGSQITDITVINWWAAYRWPEYHRATAPERGRFTFTQAWSITVNGLGVGTVRRVSDGLNESYAARDATGASIHPDVPTTEEPTYDTPHEAARALSAWAGRMGWGQDH
jgi:hypothetical protein